MKQQKSTHLFPPACRQTLLTVLTAFCLPIKVTGTLSNQRLDCWDNVDLMTRETHATENQTNVQECANLRRIIAFPKRI